MSLSVSRGGGRMLVWISWLLSWALEFTTGDMGREILTIPAWYRPKLDDEGGVAVSWAKAPFFATARKMCLIKAIFDDGPCISVKWADLQCKAVPTKETAVLLIHKRYCHAVCHAPICRRILETFEAHYNAATVGHMRYICSYR